LFAGRPFLGDFQSALLYPPNLVHLLLPHRLAINLTFVAHLWLAGTLAWAWARPSARAPRAALGPPRAGYWWPWRRRPSRCSPAIPSSRTTPRSCRSS